MTLGFLILFLHITFAAVWFGNSMTLSGHCRRAAGIGPEALRSAADLAARQDAINLGAAVLVLLTGVALVFVRGGFAVVGPRIHVALTVIVVAIAFSVAVLRPAIQRLGRAAAAEPVDADGAISAIRRVAMGAGILQTLWLVMLFLMLYKV